MIFADEQEKRYSWLI